MPVSTSFFFITTFSIVYCAPRAPQGLKHDSDRQKVGRALPCDMPNAKSRAACNKVMEAVNPALRASGIAIDETTSTFTSNIDKNEVIRSECSGTTRLNHQNIVVTAPIGRHGLFTGDAMQDTAVMDITVPVHVSAKFDVSNSMGVSMLGSCRHYHHQYFTIHADIYTDVHMTGKFSMKMSTKESEDEDEVTMQPQTELDFHYEGTPTYRWSQTGMNSLMYKAFEGHLDKMGGDAFKKAMGRKDNFMSKKIKTKLDEVIKTSLKADRNGVAVMKVPK